MTIEEILSKEENRTFDRKSINISPKDLAIPIVAFANADGGDIAIGVTDKTRRIEGIDFETKKLNELLQVPFDFCNPTIKVGIEKVPCVDEKGRENHVLVMHIDASLQVHANQADDVFLRVGDKSKLQTFEERLQLNYDKGERYFEDKAVPDATIDDIDMDFVKEYTDKIDYGKSPLEYLKENREFTNNITILTGASATGKTASFSFIRECMAINPDIVCINYQNYQKDIKEMLAKETGKLIVIDNADILLDDDTRKYISMDEKNQYLIIGRNPKNLFTTSDNLFELVSEKKGEQTEFRLKKYL